MRAISPIGYCTNVHAGADWQATRASLEKHAVEVKRRFHPDRVMGIGLWFSHRSAEQLEREGLEEFAAWLAQEGLETITLNGFPYGDFHQPFVKHDVYLPDWSEPRRREYTERLARILHRLLPAGAEGSISTVPLLWGASPAPTALSACAEQLAQLARYLEDFEKEHGRRIYLCIEPEPGCALDTADDVIRFYNEHLLPGRADQEAALRRRIRVCHDICHSAVMFESQAAAISAYARAGIEIGKVQISSAVKMPLASLSRSERQEALAQLSAFHEPKYLHQTLVLGVGETEPRFYEDLPFALAAEREKALEGGEWRVHFHVPIYVKEFGKLVASQDEILDGLRALSNHSVKHFEVETYAWSVVPDALRAPTLAEGIAREMTWIASQLEQLDWKETTAR